MQILDVLVVIGAATEALIMTGLLRGFEGGGVPDVGNGEASGAKAGTADLVVLVVRNKELLVIGVEDLALMGVGGARVGGVGDDGDVGFVGYVEAEEVVLVSLRTYREGRRAYIVRESSS